MERVSSKPTSIANHGSILARELTEGFRSVGSEFGMWDMLVATILIAAIWWSLTKKQLMQNIWYMVSLAILYAAALKGVIGKISCKEQLTKAERSRLIRWSAVFIAFFELMHGFGSFNQKNVMAAIIQWTIAFLFVFVGLRSTQV